MNKHAHKSNTMKNLPYRAVFTFFMVVAFNQACNPVPEVCLLAPEDKPDAEVKTINESILFATPNKTIYIGEDATFEFRISLENESSLSIAPYIDGCEAAELTVCSEKKSDDGLILSSVCKFNNATLLDNGVKVQFYAVSYKLGVHICRPPSFLSVKG